MQKDFKKHSIYINRHYLNNFALGFDYYQLRSFKENKLEASVLQLNFLFFNITFTRWARWI